MIELKPQSDPRHISDEEAVVLLRKWRKLFRDSPLSTIWNSCSLTKADDYYVRPAIVDYQLSTETGSYSHEDRNESLCQVALADYCVIGLEWILSNTGNQPGFTGSMNRVMSRGGRSAEELDLALEDGIKEDSGNHLGRYEEEHPWGNDTNNLVRKWMTLHPFEWHTLYRAALSWGEEVIEENLRCYAAGVEHSKEVGEQIQRCLDAVMRAWAKSEEQNG